MGCRQSPSSSETANVIKEIEGLKNFVPKSALDDFSGSHIKMRFSVAPERSEQTDDHASITTSLSDFLLPASCLKFYTFDGFMCSSVCLNFVLSELQNFSQ